MSGLSWYGGKVTSAKRIVKAMPPHDRYLEPFGGGLSVLCAKPRVELETVNDANDRVVNLYRVARDQPEDLIRAVHLTPNARREVEIAKEVSADPVEDARRMVVCCYLTRTSGGLEPRGWRFRVKSVPNLMAMLPARNAVQRVCDRLQSVQVECGDALEITERYAHARCLVYADPPYVSTQRTSADRYAVEEWGPDGHHAYIDALLGLDAMVMVSGYADGPYDRLTQAGWRLNTWESFTSRSHGRQGDTRQEVLWRNDACMDAGLPLFSTGAA